MDLSAPASPAPLSVPAPPSADVEDLGLPRAWGTPREMGDSGNGVHDERASAIHGNVLATAPVVAPPPGSEPAKQLKPKGGMMGGIRALREVEIPTVPKKFKDTHPQYHRYGPIARLGRSQPFEHITLFVIFLNALWIGWDTDQNKAKTLQTAHDQFKFGENFFCFYFTAEVIIRFMCFKKKRDCLSDGWFVFDSTLVFFMVFETWLIVLMASPKLPFPSNLLRLLRLLRLTRMVRLMRAIPELLILVKGMVAATRSVVSTLVLLIILIYVFGIVFKSQLGKEPGFEDQWGNLPISFFTLFLQGTLLDDITGVMTPMIEKEFYFCIIMMFLFILMSSFTVLNMLIGVLCEVVSETQAGEREKATVALVQEQLEEVLEEIDEDGSGMISKKEFDQIKDNDVVKAALEEIGVETKHLLALSDSLFELDDDELEAKVAEQNAKKLVDVDRGRVPDGDTGELDEGGVKDEDALRDEGKELTFADFLKTICHLRPENDCSVMDVAEVRKMMRRAIRKTERQVDEFGAGIVNLEAEGVPKHHVDALYRLLESAKDMRAKVQAETQRAHDAEKLSAELQQQLTRLGG